MDFLQEFGKEKSDQDNYNLKNIITEVNGRTDKI